MTANAINGVSVASLTAIDGKSVGAISAINGQGINSNTAIPATNLLYEHRGPDLTGADGAAISTWIDHQPTGNNLTGSATPDKRDNTLNGLPTAQFGGADGLGLTTPQSVSSFTYFAVMKCTDSNPRTLAAGDGSSPQIRINSNKIELLKATVAVIGTATTTLSTGTFYKIVVTYDGTNYAFFVNNVADGSGSNAQTFSDPVRYLGVRSLVSEPFAGFIAHQGLYDVAINSTVRGDLNTALTNLWGF